jgi:hypothetical protein
MRGLGSLVWVVRRTSAFVVVLLHLFPVYPAETRCYRRALNQMLCHENGRPDGRVSL